MITNDLNLPQPFVDAATSDHRYTPRRYSVTEVLGGTCEAVLKRRHHGEQHEDVADRVWAIFGSAVHKILEESEATESQMREQHMVSLVGDYELSGIFDLYDEETETVTDWKTTSVWSIMLDDHEKWRRQLAMYCWMLVRKGYKCRRGEIVAILRDHNKRKAATEPDYPKHPVVKLSWEFTAKDIERVEREVYAWFKEVREQEAKPDERLAPCGPESRWAKPDKWAVVKDKAKRATRVLDSIEEAKELAQRLGERDGKTYLVQFRPGEDTRCEGYCSVRDFCPYAMAAKDDPLR